MDTNTVHLLICLSHRRSLLNILQNYDQWENYFDHIGVNPDKANGVKFEMFVFDALPFSRNPVVIETRRADDFSPVKNAEGIDSPKTCREDQMRQFARWLKLGGKAIETDATGLPKIEVEVSPLFGYDEDSFADSIGKRSLKREELTHGSLYLE